jgi:CubicO group peptidase (beta-lactamase class C family)
LLGEIIRRATGQRLDIFSNNYLFNNLGIDAYEWQMLPNNVVFCSGDLRLRPRDMAKFGQIFLNKGTWKQQQIISENWVQESTVARFVMPNNWWEDGYGYQWWTKTFFVNNKLYNTFFAAGWGGQYIFVFPAKEMIVVFTGGNYFDSVPVGELLQYFILPAVN